VFQPKKVAQRVALWEKRVMEERTSEIFRRLQKKQMEVVREAEEAEQKQDQLWREQGKAEAEEAKHKQEQLWKEHGTPTTVLVNVSGLEPSTFQAQF
jgi:hypothetical protein